MSEIKAFYWNRRLHKDANPLEIVSKKRLPSSIRKKTKTRKSSSVCNVTN